MQRTALTLFGALLISGMAVHVAAASEQRQSTKANFARHHADFRGAYNQMGPIDAIAAPPALYRTDTDGFGYREWDPSWIGGRDPSVNPAD